MIKTELIRDPQHFLDQIQVSITHDHYINSPQLERVVSAISDKILRKLYLEIEYKILNDPEIRKMMYKKLYKKIKEGIK